MTRIRSATPLTTPPAPTRKLLESESLSILAVGPAACLRELYFQARELRRLSKVTFVELSQEQYALGDYTDVIETALSQMVNDPAVRAVSIYTSCLDVLLQTDFDSIITNVPNPRHVPILPFRRGPMVKRMESPLENAQAICDSLSAQNIPAATQPTRYFHSWILPPLASDFTGAVSTRACPAPEMIILTGGGCASCPRSHDDIMGTDFSYAEIDDLDVSEGIEDAVATPSVVKAKDACRDQLIFLGTPVTDATGVDGSLLREVAARSGLEAHFQATDGFHDAVKGWSVAEFNLLKRAEPTDDPNRTVILTGWSPFVFGRPDKLRSAAELLQRHGTALIVPGLATELELRSAAHASAVWVLSDDGRPAADWLSSTYGIPLFENVPVGASGWNQWLSKVGGYIDVSGESLSQPLTSVNESLSGVHTTVVVPEHPALAKAVCTMLEHDLGCQVTAMPIDRLDRLPLDGNDLLVADPLILEQRTCQSAKNIALPYPLSSGTLFIDESYEYVGDEGIEYFFQAISDQESKQ